MDAIEYAEQAKELFVLSDSFIRIKELVDDSSSTIDEIAEIILLDPALASATLKLANSPIYNSTGRIATISRAVLVLGITEIYSLVTAYSTTEAFKAAHADKKFLDEFWCFSIDTAIIIKYLATALHVDNPEQLFILGLLHNIGELAVNQYHPDKVKTCREKALEHHPWQKQQHLFNFTYGQCSAELLKLWQLPYSLIEPIREQDNSNFEHASIETKLLYIAKRLAYKANSPLDKPLDFYLSDDKLSHCGLTEEVIEGAFKDCDLERLGILAILNPGSAMIY